MDDVTRLDLLASALSGRSLRVTPVESGNPGWTDGTVIFADATTDPADLLAAVAVQASLIAAGSLDLARQLRRRPGLARRYLAVEGHRALATNEDLLPRSVRAVIDRDAAARTDSPDASLALAASREPIADAPVSFGVLRPERLLKSADVHTAAPDHAPEHVPRKRPAESQTEPEDDIDDPAAVTHTFSSPVGGGGPLAWLFRRLLGMARGHGGGPPGADAPTHRTRSGARNGRGAFSTASPGTIELAHAEHGGTKYPEWDVRHQRYRPNWCTVRETVPPPKSGSLPAMPDGSALRRPLARLGMGLDRCHRQAQGDDIDLDAAIENRVRVLAGSAPEETVYIDRLRHRRDLAVLLLLDVSGSVAEPGTAGRPVHEHQRAVAASLTGTLHDLGDRVALYAFRSQGRSAVNLLPLKHFDEAFGAHVRRRLSGLEPGGYSRLGAAIRHASAVLRERAGTSRRLLVVLSDGLAYDHGYERPYGAADARRALAETRRQGAGCVCLSIGATGSTIDTAGLRRVFGSAAHAAVPRGEGLGRVIGPLFRSALRSAEFRGPAHGQ